MCSIVSIGMRINAFNVVTQIGNLGIGSVKVETMKGHKLVCCKKLSLHTDASLATKQSQLSLVQFQRTTFASSHLC